MCSVRRGRGGVQYIGGYHEYIRGVGDIMMTVEGYHEYIGDVQYIGGHHEYIRRIS